MSDLILTPEEIALIVNKRKAEYDKAIQERSAQQQYQQWVEHTLTPIWEQIIEHNTKINLISSEINQKTTEVQRHVSQIDALKNNLRKNGCLHKTHTTERFYDDSDLDCATTYYFLCPYCDARIYCAKK